MSTPIQDSHLAVSLEVKYHLGRYETACSASAKTIPFHLPTVLHGEESWVRQLKYNMGELPNFDWPHNI
jgi:hypothetical protein